MADRLDDAPILDEAVLAKLDEDIGADRLPLLLSTFVLELERMEARLDAAILTGDRAQTVRICHSLSSSALNFGAARVGHLAERAEAAETTGDADAAMALARQALAHVPDTIRAYRQRLAD